MHLLSPERHRWLAAQRGATGLETAIILIAFVVVASVFAYTVLTAGIFTTDKSKEAVYQGIDQVSNTIELVGDTKADGIVATTLSAVDGASAWTPSANVTASTNTTDHKTGTASLDLDIAAGFVDGLIAYEDLAGPVDLSTHYAAGLWIKASTALADGVLALVIDDNAGCASPEETLPLDALEAGSWAKPHHNLADPSALSAVACVGLTAISDPGPVTLTVDGIQGPPEVHRIHIAMNNSIPTKGITFLETVDSDGDGLLSDEPSLESPMVVSFLNQQQIVRDLAWSVSELGSGDGDADLEYGETFLLTVEMRAIDPIPTANTLMTFHIAAHGDASLVIEKYAPRNVTPSMLLR